MRDGRDVKSENIVKRGALMRGRRIREGYWSGTRESDECWRMESRVSGR